MTRTRRSVRAAFAALLASAVVACASTGGGSGAAEARPASTDQIQVEKPATMIPRVNRFPSYPEELKGPNAVQQRILLEFTVRVDGTVDPATIKVVETTHEALVAPAIAAAKTWKFLPYELGPVGGPFTKYEQRIQFPLTLNPSGPESAGG